MSCGLAPRDRDAHVADLGPARAALGRIGRQTPVMLMQRASKDTVRS